MIAVVAPMLLVIAAGFACMAWLKREGDRSWAEFQRRRSSAAHFAAISASWAAVSVSFTANLRPFIEAANDASRAMARLAEILATLPTAPTDEETPDR